MSLKPATKSKTFQFACNYLDQNLLSIFGSTEIFTNYSITVLVQNIKMTIGGLKISLVKLQKTPAYLDGTKNKKN